MTLRRVSRFDNRERYRVVYSRKFMRLLYQGRRGNGSNISVMAKAKGRVPESQDHKYGYNECRGELINPMKFPVEHHIP